MKLLFRLLAAACMASLISGTAWAAEKKSAENAKKKAAFASQRIEPIYLEGIEIIREPDPYRDGYLLLKIKRDGREADLPIMRCMSVGYETSEPWERVQTDTPYPDCRSVLAYCYSGGAHCCMKGVLATSCGSGVTVDILDFSDSDLERQFVDVKGDGTKELDILDWQFANYRTELPGVGFSFPGSPAIERLIVFDQGRWRVDHPGEFVAHYSELFHETLADVPRSGSKDDEDLAASKTIESVYYFIMSGGSVESAKDILGRNLPPSWKPSAESVFRDIRKAVEKFDPWKEQKAIHLVPD